MLKYKIPQIVTLTHDLSSQGGFLRSFFCRRRVRKRRCVKMRTFFFYAQIPDFHKQGLCYYLKILYL